MTEQIETEPWAQEPPRTELERLSRQVVQMQDLLARAERDAARALRERDDMRERVSEPYGCAHCGAPKRSHGRRYLLGIGMHEWEPPTDEQVKTRMLARRAARKPLETEPPTHGKLWSLLDWSFWGAGMGDVFRMPLADTMLAAVPAETVAQAEEIMAEFIERRNIEKTGVTIYQEQRDELERLRAQVADQADADTVAARAAQAISDMGAEIRNLTGQRDQARRIAVALEQETARLEAELAKYVGHEPTIAEEMAYLSSCLDAVHDLCDAAEKQARRWEHPLPVPEWVAQVRAAASGERETTTVRPAIGWAFALEPATLHELLSELSTALLGYWHDDPDTDVLARVESVLREQRANADGRELDPATLPDLAALRQALRVRNAQLARLRTEMTGGTR